MCPELCCESRALSWFSQPSRDKVCDKARHRRDKAQSCSAHHLPIQSLTKTSRVEQCCTGNIMSHERLSLHPFRRHANNQRYIYNPFIQPFLYKLNACVCICIYRCKYSYICIYIYIYILHIYKYVCMYVCMYVHKQNINSNR